MTPFPSGPRLLGPLLAQLRLARGWSQPRLAAELCAAAGVPTLSRHEVSRWERQLRVPGDFWLGWLAVVLGAPVELLRSAATRSRALGAPPAVPGAGARSRAALLALAQRWLTDPRAPLLVGAPAGLAVGAPPGPAAPDPPDRDRRPPDELRRLDDLCGGADLAGLAAGRMRRAVRALSGAAPVARRRLLPVLAESAQLAGWLAADAGDPVGGLDAYRLALRAATAAGDVALAGHVLGSASHLLAGLGDPAGALVLARTGYAGVRRHATPGLRALLLHRVALAAALDGRATAARQALDGARRAGGDPPEPGQEPSWLYWLDGVELAAMTGRTLVALGHPGPAEAPLVAARRRGHPRGAAIYGGWLARGYLQLGEVEQASAVAGEALLDAVRAGSPRALGPLSELRRRLAGHPHEPAARRYAALVAAAGPYLPRAPAAPPGRARSDAPPGRGRAATASRIPTGTAARRRTG